MEAILTRTVLAFKSQFAKSRRSRPKIIKPQEVHYTQGLSVSKIGAATNEGKNITVIPRDDIILTFTEVSRKGITTARKSATGPEPPTRHKIRQYYHIKTTTEHSPPIEIRIMLPSIPATSRLKLWRWYPTTKRWEDITKRFSREYRLLIGETRDRLESVFGIT